MTTTDAADAVMGTVMRLGTALETLAALGAHLGADLDGTDLDPAVERVLATLTAATAPEALDLPEQQRRAIVGAIRTLFRQAADLLENPGRPVGWVDPDPQLLQSTGQGSMAVARVLAEVAPRLGGLGDALGRPGAAFCDVGTGTGWLAIAAARQWPAARVVGIDRFASALDLAEGNVAASGVGDRVELRRQDVTDLADEATFDLVWLPGPFLARDDLHAALDAAHRALRAGGWVALGLYGGPPDGAATLLADLRAIRSGGHPWAPEEAVELLEDHSFTDVHEVERTWHAPVRLTVGRVPDGDLSGSGANAG